MKVEFLQGRGKKQRPESEKSPGDKCWIGLAFIIQEKENNESTDDDEQIDSERTGAKDVTKPREIRRIIAACIEDVVDYNPERKVGSQTFDVGNSVHWVGYWKLGSLAP